MEKLEDLDKLPPEEPHPGPKENGRLCDVAGTQPSLHPSTSHSRILEPLRAVGGNQPHPPLPKPGRDDHRTQETITNTR